MTEPLATESSAASRSLALCAAALAAGAAETLCVQTRSPGGTGLGFTFAAFAQISLFAVIVGLCASAGCTLVERSFASMREQGLLASSPRRRPLDFAAAALLVAPATVFALRAGLLALMNSFKNQELVALAGALVGLAGGLVAILLWGVLSLGVPAFRRRLPSAWSAIVLLPGALLAIAIVYALRGTGMGQLDPRLLAAPGAALAFYPLAPRLVRTLIGKRSPRLALAAFVSLITVLGALASATNRAPATKLWRTGAWSRPAIDLLRRLSDFDGDRYSGWFGGGDCAPFDSAVHPGAPERPLNGVDDNCIGGDGGRPPPLPSPKPSPRTGGARPQLNLVLVTIETVRADHASLLGYSRPTMPRLAELAESSIVFERSYATTPSTRLSLAALLSGRLPSAIHWLAQERPKQMRKLGADTPWLPATLSSQGYATVAVNTNFRAFTRVESAGFERGFERYDTSTELAYSGGTMHGFPGGAQVDRALALLDEVGGRPLFLWLHLLEPHYLYEQSPNVPHFGDDELALYDAELAEADRQVGRLLDGLRARNLFDSSVLAITGDHGEEFGEHGQRWHGSNLYEPQLRTLTLLRVPGLGARRVSEPVSFLDFAPTALDLLGIQAGFSRLMGRNLAPFLRGGPAPTPGFLVENFKVDDGSQPLTGLVDWPFKLIRSGLGEAPELYDLSRDPGETSDLFQPEEPVSRRLADRLYQYLESGVAPGAIQSNGP